jgi:hypothetical protein
LSEILSREAAQISAGKIGKLAIENKREEVLQEILVFHGKKKAELFTHLVKEGFRLLEANEEKQAFQHSNALCLFRATMFR